MQTAPRDWRDGLPHVRRFVGERLPYPCVFATFSGADLYGFPSDDGDYDIRACHALPLRLLANAMLNAGGMDSQRGQTVEAMEATEHGEMDFVSHDIGKFLRLALRPNGYALEQLFSPLVIETTKWHEELIALAPGLITRSLYHHYRGFFTNQEKLYEKADEKRVKGLLYRYRVALTGIHVLRSGEIEANINTLNEWFGSSQIAELVAMKASGEAVAIDDDRRFVEEIGRIRVELEEAHAASRLPDTIRVETRAALEELHWRIRESALINGA